MTINEQKRELRLKIKERLRNLQSPYEATALAVYNNLCKTLNLEEANVIATYIDFNNELPTFPFLPELFNNHINANDSSRIVAVPFCEGDKMSFYRLRPPRLNVDQHWSFSDLAPGKFGILEPLKELRDDPLNMVAPTSIEIMLTPGLAFDPLGRRLGRGAGYYDRFLAETSVNMLIVALAFDCQIVDKIPAERFDVAVDALVTPTQILPISEKFRNSKLTRNVDC